MAHAGGLREITKTEVLYLQQICGKFLYYGRAADDTMLDALIGLEQVI